MNLLPPLKLLKQWRAEGLSPEQIYQRCLKITRSRGVIERQPRDDGDMINCEACQNRPCAKGLCRKHYNRLWRREKSNGQGESKTPQTGLEGR